MIATREFQSEVSREIYRVQSEIDLKIGRNQISGLHRAKLRELSFDLIDLEENLRSTNELSIAAEISRFNNAAQPVRLKINSTRFSSPEKRSETLKLTKKELEILRELPSGLSIKDLAEKLYLSESTIKTHLSAIYRKLRVSNRVQAIAVARDNNLLTS